MGWLKVEPIRPITPGRYPTELLTACRILRVLPGELKDWALCKTTLVLILPNGRKVIIPIEGDWAAGGRPASG